MHELLGRHVARRADDLAVIRQALTLKLLGDPEVEDPRADLPVGLADHDVRRLQIAVNDLVAMRLAERARDVRGNVQRVFGRQRTATSDPGLECLARHELHGDVPELFALDVERADVVGDHGVRALQAGEALRFAHQPRATPACTWTYDLQRDVAAERGLFRAKHLAHSAASNDLPEHVLLRDDRAKRDDR